MPKGIKVSSLAKMEANAVKFGEAAKKALAKTGEARKDAMEKVAAFEKAVKAALKEAKAASKNSGTPARHVAARKTSAKKGNVKSLAAKKTTRKVAGSIARA